MTWCGGVNGRSRTCDTHTVDRTLKHNAALLYDGEKNKKTLYNQRSTGTCHPPWCSEPVSTQSSSASILSPIVDQSLTLSQFCARLKTALFCRAYETLA